MKAKRLFFSISAALALLFLPASSFAFRGGGGGGFHGGGFHGGGWHGGGWHGGGWHGGGFRYGGLHHFGGYRFAHVHRRQFFYGGYYPYYSYPHYCRVIWTYYGPHRVCGWRHWHRYYW